MELQPPVSLSTSSSPSSSSFFSPSPPSHQPTALSLPLLLATFSRQISLVFHHIASRWSSMCDCSSSSQEGSSSTQFFPGLCLQGSLLAKSRPPIWSPIYCRCVFHRGQFNVFLKQSKIQFSGGSATYCPAHSDSGSFPFNSWTRGAS